MIIDTIKLIASDLADMSPKTQLEIVKLCKNLCLAVKDYLIENDENIETINEYIENLQTAVSNLTTSITDLSGELTTAEGNIQANANAILNIQDAIGVIESALNNVYTKTQIDTMLASIYTKSEVDTLLLDYYKKAETYSKTEVDTKLSLYYTMIQVNDLLSGKLNASDVCFLTIENRYTPVSVEDFNKMYASKLGVIFYNGYKYYYTGATTVNDVITLNFNSYVVEDGVTKILALLSDTRLISPLDTDVAQPILVSGTNIKTINGQSLLGSGNLVVGATLKITKVVSDDHQYIQFTEEEANAINNGAYVILTNNYEDDFKGVFSHLGYEDDGDENLIKLSEIQCDFELIPSDAIFDNTATYYILSNGNYTKRDVTETTFDRLKSRLYFKVSGNKIFRVGISIPTSPNYNSTKTYYTTILAPYSL